jgi:hypothetical protein
MCWGGWGLFENLACLAVFFVASVNALVFFLRERRYLGVQRGTSLVVDSTRTYWLWDPRGKPKRWVETWILLLYFVVLFPLGFIVPVLFLSAYEVLSAYPFIIGFVGFVLVEAASDYELLGFAGAFAKSRPTRVGEGDLLVFRRTRNALRNGVWLSLFISLGFLILAWLFTPSVHYLHFPVRGASPFPWTFA